MKLKLLSCWVVVLVFSLTLSSFAGEWLDEFDKGDLDEAWSRITDLPAEQGSVTIEDGKLLLNEPSGSFAHTAVDGRPLVLRAAPDGDFSISALIDTDPPPPSEGFWAGLFIVGKNGEHADLAHNWAVSTVGGVVGVSRVLIGSMKDAAWNDNGHFDVPEWPIHLKLEKVEAQYTGYYREASDDEWIKVGATWDHLGMEEPELVGFGIVNVWAGANLTLIADYFLLEGENVTSMSVRPMDKLPSAWGQIKATVK